MSEPKALPPQSLRQQIINVLRERAGTYEYTLANQADEILGLIAAASAPDGWFPLGSHVDWAGQLELSAEVDEAGLALWERPLPLAEGVPLAEAVEPQADASPQVEDEQRLTTFGVSFTPEELARVHRQAAEQNMLLPELLKAFALRGTEELGAWTPGPGWRAVAKGERFPGGLESVTHLWLAHPTASFHQQQTWVKDFDPEADW